MNCKNCGHDYEAPELLGHMFLSGGFVSNKCFCGCFNPEQEELK